MSKKRARISKKPSLNSIELRTREGKPFAVFKTFRQAAKACITARLTFAAIYESTAHGWELVGEYTYDN